MKNDHVVIVGGGLAGLAAGCYARASGYRTTVVEHNITLGGVCTAWDRGDYVVDGCIHWLTGGPFAQLYEELGILPRVALRVLKRFATVRHVGDGFEVEIGADLDQLSRMLTSLAPKDREEIDRLMVGARQMAEVRPEIDGPRDLQGMREGMRTLWAMRRYGGLVGHFRGTTAEYAAQHLSSSRLQHIVSGLVGAETPVLFLLMVLGYLSRGWLSRPEGGTTAFRDALIASYTELGGDVRLPYTVDEILLHDDHASGVRLHDGTIIDADAVICTSSVPETVFRLLGGRYEAEETTRRMRDWKMVTPIVLASYGVELPLADQPALLHMQGLEPFEVGDRPSDSLYLRICNDDLTFAPAGHAVVQALVETNYTWWARQGSAYTAAKEAVGESLLGEIDRYLPGVRAACRMTDIATPLTYWNMARSWRGAYEGWMPLRGSRFGGIDHQLAGLEGFYLAGQWVEPGGGIPTACRSARQAVQLMCAQRGDTFAVPHPAHL